MGARDRNAVHSAGGRLAYGVTDFTANSGAFPYDGTELGLASTCYVIPPNGVYMLPMEEDGSTARAIYTGGDAIAGVMLAGVTDTDVWTALFPGAAVGSGLGGAGGDSLIYPSSVGQTQTPLSNLYFESDNPEHLNWLMPQALPMWEESEQLYFSHYRRQYFPMIFRSQSDSSGRAVIFSTTAADTLPPPAPDAIWDSANLQGWWRGDLGVTESGGAVSAWANQGSAGGSLTPTSNSPTYTASTIGGQPGIYFPDDLAEYTLQLSSWAGLTSAPITVIVVAQSTGDVNERLIHVGEPSLSNDDFWYVQRNAFPRTQGFAADGTNSANANDAGSPLLTVNTPYRISFTEDGTDLDVYTAIGGSSHSMNADSSAVNVDLSGGKNKVTVGSTGVGISSMFEGYIVEIVILNKKASAAELADFDTYANLRYGTSFA